jgi:hypothetical protein
MFFKQLGLLNEEFSEELHLAEDRFSICAARRARRQSVRRIVEISPTFWFQ